ncbi:GntR family transcriptional regulator, partial [Streptomyces sp. NPDC001508]|uniref:FadR/GntR family transcriptional regulator n=1 Tax=Streptomyces sp. NPDC001508 TaxID=3154656 RepID=UPI00332746C1
LRKSTQLTMINGGRTRLRTGPTSKITIYSWSTRRKYMAGRRPTLVDEVREGLIESITNGTYGVGDRLPNEQEIGEQFNVSRATVREAYRQLIDAGYLHRRHGAGTFVSRASASRARP